MPTVSFVGILYRATYLRGQKPDFSRQVYAINFSETKSGISNPLWRTQVRNHQNATTPYSCDRLKVDRPKDGWSYVTKNTLVPGQLEIEDSRGWFIQSITVPQLGSTSGLSSQAYMTFVRKANEEMRALQAFVSLGELRETLHSIRHPADALKRGIQDYLIAAKIRSQRAVWKHPARSRRRIIADVLSGTYLEYANGWKPLMADIEGASRALAEHFNPSGLGYRKVSATARAPTAVVTPAAFISGAGGHFSWYQQDFEEREASCRIVGEVVVRCDGSVEALGESLGFRLREFVPTVWELIPISYVADYFVNIGTALEAWCFNKASVTWWSQGTRRKSVRIHLGIPKPQPTPGGLNQLVSYAGNPGEVKLTRTGFVRTFPTDATPTLAFSLPDKHLFAKLANVSSLLWQARSSSKAISELYR